MGVNISPDPDDILELHAGFALHTHRSRGSPRQRTERLALPLVEAEVRNIRCEVG